MFAAVGEEVVLVVILYLVVAAVVSGLYEIESVIVLAINLGGNASGHCCIKSVSHLFHPVERRAIALGNTFRFGGKTCAPHFREHIQVALICRKHCTLCCLLISRRIAPYYVLL